MHDASGPHAGSVSCYFVFLFNYFLKKIVKKKFIQFLFVSNVVTLLSFKITLKTKNNIYEFFTVALLTSLAGRCGTWWGFMCKLHWGIY
jgi:hypothetical protein